MKINKTFEIILYTILVITILFLAFVIITAIVNPTIFANGMGAEEEWLINPANPASPVHQLLF